MANILLAIGIVIVAISICITTVVTTLNKVLNTQDDKTSTDIESIALNALSSNAFSICIADARPLPITTISQKQPKVNTNIIQLPLPLVTEKERKVV